MLYKLRVRKPVAGVTDLLIDAQNASEADWRGRAVCDEQEWRFISCEKAVVADESTHPMPKAVVEKKAARVGA